ncbi:DUF5723 family protein [Candidatus Sulfidibacterium hydrothermale]|uniref:DUF5723 family protein n=1 Tax=Candidatus Sulfidibacterium hydrothermale TaxID=2875962 RepID=UPI001F0B276D|nr:DUF5723 family protein [Candidatus Sulfidibacterium hydrothermale]UBM61624.1 DUF5723 family protein [Candidatus Sulfidibacterium hydrothermale]
MTTNRGEERSFVKLLLFLIILFSGGYSTLTAQQMTGLGFDNYNGAAGAMLNPAFLSNSKVYLDANLITTDVFAENNMGYFDKDTTSFWDLVRMVTKPSYQGPDAYSVLYENHDKKNFYVSSRIQGPSFMLQDGRQAFAIGITVRSVSSAVDIPYEIVLSKGRLSDSSLVNNSFDDKNFSFSSLNWAELNLSYAYDLIDRGNTKLTVGGTFKILFGIGGAYSTVNQVKYNVPDRTTLDIENFDSKVAFALPIDYNDYETTVLDPLFKGHGVGMDIGILYTKLKTFTDPGEKRLCAKPYADYIYKIGISLMDIGGIRFNHHAEVHSFDNVNAKWEQFDTVSTPNVRVTMQTLSSVFYGSPNQSLTDTSFFMSLPTTLSIQYDYHFNGNFYLAGYWQQPLRFRLRTVRLAPVLAVIPRYETRIFGASLPVTFYNYEKLRVGASLRFYSVTIGTEKLGTFLGIGDLTGMDFYFSIRFNLDKGRCMSYFKGACSNARFGAK